MSVAIELTPQFGWVLIIACLIGLQCIIIGFMITPLRKKMNVKYPDMGNGIYANKLSKEEWETFNNFQRGHYNYVEGIATVLVFLLISGLFFANVASKLGIVYLIGRQLYAYGYQKSGAMNPFRRVGAITLDLSLLSMFGLAIYGSLQLVGYF